MNMNKFDLLIRLEPVPVSNCMNLSSTPIRAHHCQPVRSEGNSRGIMGSTL